MKTRTLIVLVDAVMVLLFAAWFTLLAYSSCGCAGKPTAGYTGQTVPVAIVAWPKPVQPSCEIPEVPRVPELHVYENPGGVALDRMYVNRREVEDLAQWQRDLKLWADQVGKCFDKLVDRSGNE